MDQTVRTRFAPSPTGFLHIGGVRTALFSWLVAKQSGGQFVLRIEDTDKAREVAGSEQHIIDCLKWLDLEWDEGPIRQSERRAEYHKYAQKLIRSGRAYADTRSPEELGQIRKEFAAAKKPVLFRQRRPESPPDWRPGMPLRFKSAPQAYSWHDEVMGNLSTGEEAVDDFILIKSDGLPTYNFAHIVDDFEMGITHVIRTQEFLASVPKFLNLYKALGMPVPKLATLPYVMGPDGKKKLSKRDGAKDVLDYKKEGFLPEAIISYLATLGWNDGTEQEVFSQKELIAKFSLDRVQKGGAKFDEKRLLWVNGNFIRQLDVKSLFNNSEGFWPAEAKEADSKLKARVLEVSKDRLKKFSEMPELTDFFFNRPKHPEEIAAELAELFAEKRGDMAGQTPVQWLNSVIKLVENCQITSPGSLEQPIKDLVGSASLHPHTLFGSLRVALTGAEQTPPVWEVIYALGKAESLSRLGSIVNYMEK